MARINIPSLTTLGIATALLATACGPVADLEAGSMSEQEFSLAKLAVSELVAEGRFDQALEPTYELLDQQPEDTELLATATLVVDQVGYPEDAVSLAEQAYDLDPKNPILQNNLAYSYALLGQELDEAWRLAISAIHHLPHDSAIRDTVGWVLFKRGEAKRALYFVRSAMPGAQYPWAAAEVADHEQQILEAIENGE